MMNAMRRHCSVDVYLALVAGPAIDASPDTGGSTLLAQLLPAANVSISLLLHHTVLYLSFYNKSFKNQSILHPYKVLTFLA